MLIPRIASSRLSDNVKSYLTGYAKWLAGRLNANDHEFRLNWAEVSLDVPAYWKGRFPLRGHPNWDQSSFRPRG